MDTNLNFTSIDFRILTDVRTSACAIGMVKVKNGEIVDKYYSLIKPIPDNYKKDRSAIYGITREMVADAPTFEELWPKIKDFIGDDFLTGYSAEASRSIFDKQLYHYKLDDPNKYKFISNFFPAPKNIKNILQKNDIEYKKFRTALDDAEYGAHLYLIFSRLNSDSEISFSIEFKPTDPPSPKVKKTRTKKEPEIVIPPKLIESSVSDEDIINKETPFYGKNIVISGSFINMPDKDSIGKMISKLGGNVYDKASEITHICIIGLNGPSDDILLGVNRLRKKGQDIRYIFEAELRSILSQANLI